VGKTSAIKKECGGVKGESERKQKRGLLVLETGLGYSKNSIFCFVVPSWGKKKKDAGACLWTRNAQSVR